MCDQLFTNDKKTNNDTCSDCTESIKTPAYLQCNVCDKIWGLVNPGPMKYGIILEAGKKYKTTKCCHCSTTVDENFELVETTETFIERMKTILEATSVARKFIS